MRAPDGPAAAAASASAVAIIEAVHAELPGLEAAVRPLVHAVLAFAAAAAAAAPHDDGKSPRPVRGVVIEGPSGVGKTSLARAVARHSGLSHRYVAGASVFGASRGDAERAIHTAFRECTSAAAAAALRESRGGSEGPPPPPSILILDELEAMGKARAHAQHMADLGALAALLECLDDSGGRPGSAPVVFVMGVASDVQRVDRALLQPGRLEGLIRLGTPSAAERRAMLRGLLGRLPLAGGAEDEEGASSLTEELTRRTRGFTGADLARLCSEALAHAATTTAPQSDQVTVGPAAWEAALESARPAGIPWSAPGDARLSDLAGVDEALGMVTQAVLLPLSRPQALAAMGVPKASMGVLLHGPPGTGKSLLGRALAAAARPYASFLSVECPELINKVVGESERAVARLFQTARQAAPCILFLDHVEAIAGKRGFDTSSENTVDRLLSTLLVEMDGVGSAEAGATATAPVIVIAATNHRDLLDEAILRPGRLDLHVELPLPDQAARAAIFTHHLKRLPLTFDLGGHDGKEEQEDDEGVGDLEALAEALAAASDGLSGAGIRGVCQEAAMQSLRESLESRAVRPRHVWAALREQV